MLLAAALTSHQLGHGHVCLDLIETLKAPDFALSLPPEGDLQTGAMLLPSQLLDGLDGGERVVVYSHKPLKTASRIDVELGARLFRHLLQLLCLYWVMALCSAGLPLETILP